MDEVLQIDGVAVPRFLYGTAWKETETERLTGLAIAQGFRGIDTANQRKHYHEESVGRAIRDAIKAGQVRREDLFLQTKFTFLRGQDHRLPYDADAPIQTQVAQSFESSLEHLGTDHIDSYVLHGPSTGDRLKPADWQAWRAMEAIFEGGRARLLGISNVNLEQIKLLCAQAKVQPRFVQNRCYASKGWDRGIRLFCRENGIIYQGFSLLTANRQVLALDAVKRIARRNGVGVAQVIFRYSLDIGMVALTGTTKATHMAADLAIKDFQLSSDDMSLIEQIAG